MHRRTVTHRSRLSAAFATIAAACLILAGCASDAPAEGADTGDTAAAVAAAAKDGVAPFLAAGTAENEWSGPTEAPAPKPGQKVTIISQMNATGAALPATAMKEAAERMGWTATIVDNQGRPDLKLAAINAAVDEKVDAIVLVFVDPSIVSSAVKRAQDASIAVVSYGVPKDSGLGVHDVHPDYLVEGTALAQYLVWKTDADVHLLLEEASDEPAIVDGHDKAVRDYLQNPHNCPGCSVTTNQYVLSNFVDPTSGPAAQASATLQADPSIGWVTCFDACLFQVISAVDRAGLADRVQAAGFNCTPENLKYILDGHVEAACVADSFTLTGWATIDNVNRILNGEEPFDYTSVWPIAVFDKDSLSSLSEDDQADILKNGWDGNVDFRSEFAKIWGVD